MATKTAKTKEIVKTIEKEKFEELPKPSDRRPKKPLFEDYSPEQESAFEELILVQVEKGQPITEVSLMYGGQMQVHLSLNKRGTRKSTIYILRDGTVLTGLNAMHKDEYGPYIPETYISAEDYQKSKSASEIERKEKFKSPEIGNSQTTSANLVQEIPLTCIVPSPLKSQERRRARFDETGLDQLATSIIKHGVINPVTLRSISSPPMKHPFETHVQFYELVAGERRWAASKKAEKETVRAIVQEFSDSEILEIQIIENLQREGLHPLDEAYSYQDLMDGLGCDEQEVALRVGKPASYVTNRLKLHKLQGDVQTAFETGEITLSHALEIAKYPAEAQKEIYPMCFNNFSYASQSLVPLAKFIASIQKNYLLQLKQAPFSIKSEDLRADALPCVKCPERTSANPLLFEENYSDRDCCLNRSCWQAKTAVHIQIQRRTVIEKEIIEQTKAGYRKKIEKATAEAGEITDPHAKGVAVVKIKQIEAQFREIEKFGIESSFVPKHTPKEIEKNIKKVPLVAERSFSYYEEKPKEPVVEKYSYTELKRSDECEFAETGVFFNGDRVGQKVYICRDNKCKKHGKNSSGTASAKSSEKDLEERRLRKEEIFDVGVGEPVRLKVLKIAAGCFDEKQTIFSHPKAEIYLAALVERLWKLQVSHNAQTAKNIREILELEKGELGLYTWDDNECGTERLSGEKRSQLLFLILHAPYGELFKGGYWKSQKEIKEIADDFEIDYRLLDAQERLGSARMKDKDMFRHYLQEIEAGNADAKIPRSFSTKYKTKE